MRWSGSDQISQAGCLIAIWCLAATVADAAASQKPCPAWLTEYIDWHKAHKFHPDSRFIVYDCPEGSCAGLADRLRCILWLLRLAAHLKRVLLIRMNVPVPLHHLFEPTLIDWHVPDTGTFNGSPVVLDAPPPENMSRFGSLLSEKEIQDFLADKARFMSTYTNQWEDWRLFPPEPQIVQHSRATSCMMQALLKPSQEVEAVVTRQLAEMQVNPKLPYIAVHLRTWQLVGEHESQNHTLHAEERILTSILCAREMAPQCNVDLALNPAVLITDGLHIRRRVGLRLYHQLTTTLTTPHHFDTLANNGLLERHLETIADFTILSRASGIFIDTRSGFSRMASYLAGLESPSPCLQENLGCSRWLPYLDYKLWMGQRSEDQGQGGQG